MFIIIVIVFIIKQASVPHVTFEHQQRGECVTTPPLDGDVSLHFSAHWPQLTYSISPQSQTPLHCTFHMLEFLNKICMKYFLTNKSCHTTQAEPQREIFTLLGFGGPVGVFWSEPLRPAGGKDVKNKLRYKPVHVLLGRTSTPTYWDSHTDNLDIMPDFTLYTTTWITHTL